MQDSVIKTVPRTDGHSGCVSVIFQNLPYRERKDGRRTYAYPDFGSDLRNRIFSENSLPFAKKSGVLRKIARCPQCGEQLVETTTNERQRFHMTFDLERGVSIGIEISIPCSRCDSCSSWVVSDVSSASSDISDAIIDAIQRAFINP